MATVLRELSTKNCADSENTQRHRKLARQRERMDSADEISNLTLKKIKVLLNSRDPPLSRALFVRLVLKRVTEDPGPKRGTQPNCLRGFIEYITSFVGQPLTFFNTLRNTITLDNEAQEDETEVEEDDTEHGLEQVRYEELMGIKNVGSLAREARLAEQEKIQQNWQLLQEKGKRSVKPERSLKRDPSAELIMGIVNDAPPERVPPNRFLKVASN